jgi:hypothetical protein
MNQTFKTQELPADQAEAQGYNKFNSSQHLCVDVPDGSSTITCKLSDGSKVTFAFCSYADGKPAAPGCVDVQVDTGIPEHQLPCETGGHANGQGVILFHNANLKGSKRKPDIRTVPNEGYALATVLLKKHYTQ